jgi:hypothetical protein
MQDYQHLSCVLRVDRAHQVAPNPMCLNAPGGYTGWAAAAPAPCHEQLFPGLNYDNGETFLPRVDFTPSHSRRISLSSLHLSVTV